MGNKTDYTIYKLSIVAIVNQILRAFTPGHLLVVDLIGCYRNIQICIN